MGTPVKRRMKTPKKLEPQADLGRETVRAEFVDLRNDLANLLRAADGLDLDAIRMTSPFLSLLKMPLYSFYQVLLIHGRRHIWLAKEIAGAR